MEYNVKVKQNDFIKKILDDLIIPHLPRIELSRKRQHALFKHQKPDKWPIKIMDQCPEEYKKLFPVVPEEDPELEFFRLLCDWLRISLTWLNSESDIVPFIYAQFGTGTNLACVGMEPLRANGTYGTYGPPHPLGLEKALALTIDDIKICGTFSRALDFMQYAKDMTNDLLPVCKPDCQSPFSLACMIMGNDFYTSIFDNPGVTKEFLDFSLELFCRSEEWCKEVDNEPLTEMEGGGLGISSKSYGTSLSIDHAVMLSPNAIDEFVIPTSRKAAHMFGGATIHYCGWHEALTNSLAHLSEAVVINNGIVPSKKYEIPFEEVIELCRKTNTIYHGNIPIKPDEKAVSFVDKLYDWANAGLLLPMVSFSMLKEKPDCPWKSGAELADYWYSK